MLTPIEITLGGWIIGILCSVIAFFLYRLIGQFDTLNKTVVQLNATMIKIDKDLTTKITVLESTQTQHTKELRGLDEIYNRMRSVESDVTILNASGCKYKNEC